MKNMKLIGYGDHRLKNNFNLQVQGFYGFKKNFLDSKIVKSSKIHKNV